MERSAFPEPRSRLVPIALAMGLMLSPPSLVVLGNMAGETGFFFLAAVALAAFVHFVASRSYGFACTRFPGPAGEIQFLQEVFGPLPAVVFPVGVRVAVAICLAPLMLSTAGYVFNEVFLYWFPNFAFAYLVLVLVVALNLISRSTAEKAQVVFILLALGGLLFLAAAGIAGSERFTHEGRTVDRSIDISMLFPALLLFIGFDLAGGRRAPSQGMEGDPARAIAVAVVLAAGCFALWGVASAVSVPWPKLAESTIPHMVAARTILGQKGRIIMGIMVIAGVCGAMNALLHSVSRTVAGAARLGLLPPFLGRGGEKAAVPLLLLAGGGALMTALGFAGEPVLEVYVRGGLLLWLLLYAAVLLAGLVVHRRLGGARPSRAMRLQVTEFIALGLLLAGLLGLWRTGGETAGLSRFMLALPIGASALILPWLLLGRKERERVGR